MERVECAGIGGPADLCDADDIEYRVRDGDECDGAGVAGVEQPGDTAIDAAGGDRCWDYAVEWSEC